MTTRRVTMRGNKVQMSIKVDLDQFDALTALAERRRQSVASLVRLAIDTLLADEDGTRQGEEAASETHLMVRA